ncbi:cation-transporting P-type ATPase [Nonomuraea sp. NPDC046802]|uniref:cation-transporting P-type ATPase n=1 Tax=Nonomuraea sp. NPDC046802 TaxID=3154919 RepID=UPI0033E6334F
MGWAPEAPSTGSSRLELLRRLDTGPRGLLESEAEARLRLHGENTLPLRPPLSWPRRLAAACATRSRWSCSGWARSPR